MMNSSFLKFCFVLSICFSITSINTQTIFYESFEIGTLPEGWEIETQATDGGWNVASSASLSSDFFTISNNGSDYIIGTNDDACNCDKSNDRLITPEIDLTGYTFATLSFDMFYGGSSYQGIDELAGLYFSFDKVDWVKLKDFESNNGWEKEFVDLSPFADQKFYLSIVYNDGGGWLFGCAIDNMAISVPLGLDCGVTVHKNLLYGEIGDSYHIPLELKNHGATIIEEVELEFLVNGELIGTERIDGLSLAPFDQSEIAFTDLWVPEEAGLSTVEVNILSVNGDQDEDISNNRFNFNVDVYNNVERKNIIDDILLSNPKISQIANSSNLLDKPTDLDFFPVLGRNELWLVNERVESSGGSTVIIRNATNIPSDFEHQVDGNAWHFMSLPTGIAFSNDNHNFATSPGVQDANHSGGTFTGPTLWSSDPEIYAQPSGGNGSHMDMLHGSPLSMGIAHEIDNVFWVYDNWNKDIVRYDFVDDHGPGNDDHSDAIVRRYRNIGINAFGNIPNHMVLDKETGWLYFVDNGNARVMRLNINSGNTGNALPLINEPLAEHSEVINFDIEEIITSDLIYPCGVELVENRLLVTDYSNGDIIVYDIENNFTEIGRIYTDIPGITGLVVGPEGNIWYTNREANTLMKVEQGELVSSEDVYIKNEFQIFPNPTSGILHYSFVNTNSQEANYLSLFDSAGRLVFRRPIQDINGTINLKGKDPGFYFLTIENGSDTYFKKLIIQK